MTTYGIMRNMSWGFLGGHSKLLPHQLGAWGSGVSRIRGSTTNAFWMHRSQENANGCKCVIVGNRRADWTASQQPWGPGGTGPPNFLTPGTTNGLVPPPTLTITLGRTTVLICHLHLFCYCFIITVALYIVFVALSETVDCCCCLQFVR